MEENEIEPAMKKIEDKLEKKELELKKVNRKIEDFKNPQNKSFPKPDKEVISLITAIVILIAAIIRLIKP